MVTASQKYKERLQKARTRYIDKFVFIHINKTGGSSIEKALNLPLEHKTAIEKIRKMGRKRWNSRFTFAVVRNPWDKVVSHYHYRVQTGQTGMGDKHISFPEWVKRAYGAQDPRYYDKPRMFMPQIDWIADSKGNILVDKILHFENINKEFQEAMKTIGKDITLPHTKSSKRGDYREYYDQASIEIIRNWFQKDITAFSYQF